MSSEEFVCEGCGNFRYDMTSAKWRDIIDMAKRLGYRYVRLAHSGDSEEFVDVSLDGNCWVRIDDVSTIAEEMLR